MCVTLNVQQANKDPLAVLGKRVECVNKITPLLKPKDRPRRRSKEEASEDWHGPEAVLEAEVEGYLRLLGVRYLHIPSHLQRHLRQSAPPHIARMASEAFKGLPDLTCFGANGSCLLIELKVASGRLSQGQEAWHKGLPVQVVRSFGAAKLLIDRWYENGGR